jgi:hypothetical protein
VENFSLGFQGCFRAGRDEVRCYMKITNNDFDKDLEVKVGCCSSASLSKLFDDLSNEYTASKITIANTEINSGDGSATLIRGIPATAVFIFEDISPSANILTLFQPGFEAESVAFEGDFRSFGESSL